MISADGNELLDEDHIPVDGVSLSLDDVRAIVAKRHPRKAYCVVKQ
ncbi:hypothetical protein PS928_06786 [Pseudomonas fluorescens]|uniref:Uncharacterized protein n=1 Tax=Pseudomonas fluorescens TaxID=294 RepID=A0A5E7VUY7_PSEFL|nr:hypothetical protein PS928_06786 [Pseudomonas fluorescens]